MVPDITPASPPDHRRNVHDAAIWKLWLGFSLNPGLAEFVLANYSDDPDEQALAADAHSDPERTADYGRYVLAMGATEQELLRNLAQTFIEAEQRLVAEHRATNG